MKTLKTLKDATEQDIFDQVCTHLLTQGKPAKNESGKCVYKNGNGMSCAIGSLIGEDEYKPEWEGTCYDEFIFLTSELDTLLNLLRIVHDDYSPRDWEERLKKTAMNNNLKFNYKETA